MNLSDDKFRLGDLDLCLTASSLALYVPGPGVVELMSLIFLLAIEYLGACFPISRETSYYPGPTLKLLLVFIPLLAFLNEVAVPKGLLIVPPIPYLSPLFEY